MTSAAIVPAVDGRALAALDQAKAAIAEARAAGNVESLKEWRDQAAALQHYHSRRDNAQAVANDAGEVKLRAERALALIDLEANPHGGKRDGGSSSVNTELDVDHSTRAAWRKMAKLDEDVFDAYLERARRDEHAGVSTAQVVKLIKADSLGVHHSSVTDEWATPQDLFDELDTEFSFELDVCALDSSAKCPTYFTPETDGLSQDWKKFRCWMNPPYGDVIGDWMRKASEEAAKGAIVVCLVPARVDTGWWWDYCLFGEIRFLKGRLRFGGSSTGAPFPSAIVVLGPGYPPKVRWWNR